MKKLFITLMMFTTSFAFASSTNTAEEAKTSLIEKVKSIVNVQKIVDALHLNGDAVVWVTVDENGNLIIDKIESNNFVMTYHIRKSLEGIQLEVQEDMIGKSFIIEMEFAQSK